MKKYKKDGSLSKRWLQAEQYRMQGEETARIYKEEDQWYREHGIDPAPWFESWRQKELFEEKQKREKLSSELTTCVYCNRPIRKSRQAYIKRWEGKHSCYISTDTKHQKLEYDFQWHRICFGCGNVEHAIGEATVKCEAALASLKREIHAQTY